MEPVGRLKLAIVSTHPIQYYAPVFRALTLSNSVSPRVFFTWSQSAEGALFDPGFGMRVSWDIPLRDGYDHVFVRNVAKQPGTGHFNGIQNPTLNREIADWGASAVLIYGWNLSSHLSALRHFKGRVPVLFRGDSTLLDPRNRIRSLARKIWLRWVYSHVDVAIAVGQNNRDYYTWCGLNAARIAFAPHSVDTHRFRDGGGDDELRAQRWRSELGIPEHEVVFLFAAKFIPKKAPMLLLDAFLAMNSAAHLILAGTGELEPMLRGRAAGSGNVHFLPFQNQRDMPAVYRLGDVYVLPSRGPGETWGLALNEAMASARAVISSSSAGGARDLVQRDVTGWIFNSGDAEDLTRVMQTALRHGRKGLLQIGAAAQRASAGWSTEAAAEAIAAAAIDACNGGDPANHAPV